MELVAGYTGKDGKFIKQVTVPFDLDSDEYRLDLYVLGNTYTVQVNGQTLIDRRPLFYPNGLVGYHTLGPARFDTLKITTAKTDDPGEQVYVSDFDQKPGGAGWVPFSGEWEIADGELVQANPAAQDAGIGFEGSAFEDYGLQVTFRHLTGAGGGLLFNMPSPYQLNGAHVVRYSDQADSVFWGYYDDQGLFTRQGFANADPPGTETHQLRVFVGSDSYDVYLDDQLLARASAHRSSSGGHGSGAQRRPYRTYHLTQQRCLQGGRGIPAAAQCGGDRAAVQWDACCPGVPARHQPDSDNHADARLPELPLRHRRTPLPRRRRLPGRRRKHLRHAGSHTGWDKWRGYSRRAVET